MKGIRTIIADTLLGWALSIMPAGEDRQDLAKTIHGYMTRALERQVYEKYSQIGEWK